MSAIAIKTTVSIDMNTIADLLTSAFESGYTDYWCERVGEVSPFPENLWVWSEYPDCPSYVTYPLSVGGAILCIEDSGDGDKPRKRSLTLTGIKKGLQAMAIKAPHHFANIVNKNWDAETGDVFLQFCLLGENRYG